MMWSELQITGVHRGSQTLALLQYRFQIDAANLLKRVCCRLQCSPDGVRSYGYLG